MARGVCLLFGSDIGLATTGYAEPAPATGVTSPIAWWALCHRDAQRTLVSCGGKIEHPGLGRIEMQKAVTEEVLNELVSYLKKIRKSG